ncbi:putative DNA repair exonuclease SIA1 [Handroanthus impetiginosus]|uniref:Putative DNA repair exonuclease SIA1 n=1 Tax=Handroanthus impetiginosus TaxID=429701 RepID=A0A2G9HRC4_9LAMI|nr:putative DNA repair exonuclease SIA1 [Handroanthus impetiginosus]
MHMSTQWTLICLSLILTVRSADLHGAAQSTVPLCTTSPEDNLRMQAGARFKIALFADLHFGEDAWTEWGPQQDLNSVRVMSTVLDKEQPDFVIYLGDVITANNIMIKNASFYWDQAVSPTRARGIPWSSVFGNHDDAPFEWPMEWFSVTGIPQIDCPASTATYSGDKECSFRGTTRLELMKGEIQQDTLSYSKQEVISSAQVKWFQQKSEELNPDSSVPEVIFWHIPSKAYKKVAPKFGIHWKCVGSIFLERVAAQKAEMGIMKVLEERRSVKAVFVGHNHGLDWCCPYKNMWLCFARHTGYGGYGNWPRGARILEINQQPFSLKTWIRMEDGDEHSEVLLSS